MNHKTLAKRITEIIDSLTTKFLELDYIKKKEKLYQKVAQRLAKMEPKVIDGPAGEEEEEAL